MFLDSVVRNTLDCVDGWLCKSYLSLIYWLSLQMTKAVEEAHSNYEEWKKQGKRRNGNATIGRWWKIWSSSQTKRKKAERHKESLDQKEEGLQKVEELLEEEQEVSQFQMLKNAVEQMDNTITYNDMFTIKFAWEMLDAATKFFSQVTQ